MSSNESDPVTFKFLPISIRLETLGGIATPLLLRGTPLPATRTEKFATASDNQEKMEVHILMGESSLVRKCRSLGKFQASGIPPAPRGRQEIVLTFTVQPNCSIQLQTGVDETVLANFNLDAPVTLLTSESIAKIKSEADLSKDADEEEVSLIEARAAGEAAIRAAEEKLQGGLSNPEAVKRAIAELGQCLESSDSDQIREATQLLNSHLNSIFGNSVFDDLFTRTPSRSTPQRTFSRKGTPPKTHARQGNSVATAANPDSNLGKIFGGGEFTLDPNLCFVLMPFEETFRPIYEDHIKPTVQNEGLTCLRADDILGTSLITRDIWEKINRARFIIADLSGQNPNVFYEVGLAHALGKDVVLLTQTMTDVPFDLKALRCLIYNYTPRGMKELETSLQATIVAVMKIA